MTDNELFVFLLILKRAQLSQWNHFFELDATANIIHDVHIPIFALALAKPTVLIKDPFILFSLKAAGRHKTKNMFNSCPHFWFFPVCGFLFFGQWFVLISFLVYAVHHFFCLIDFLGRFACVGTVCIKLFPLSVSSNKSPSTCESCTEASVTA